MNKRGVREEMATKYTEERMGKGYPATGFVQGTLKCHRMNDSPADVAVNNSTGYPRREANRKGATGGGEWRLKSSFD